MERRRRRGEELNKWALHFNGTDQYIDAEGALDYLESPDTAKSISFWAKQDVNQANAVFVYASNDVRVFVFSIRNGADIGFYTNFGTLVRRSSILASTLDTSVWHHYVATDDGNATGKLYIDSVLQTNNNGNTWSATNGDYQVIAKRPAGYFLDGLMDNFGIFNRVLTQSDVNKLYGKGTPKTACKACNISGIIVHWSMEEGSGAYVYDKIGSKTGTIMNPTPAIWERL